MVRNRITKTLFHGAILAAPALIVMLLPASPAAEVDIGEGYFLDYRVIDLEKRGASRFKLSEAQEKVTGFSNCLTRQIRDGEAVIVLERDEKLSTGDRVFWTYVMEPGDMSLVRVEKRVTSRSGKVVRETWVDYRDPMFNYPKRLAHINTIASVIQALPLYCDCVHEFYLMLSLDFQPWHIFATVEEIETIKVPAGEFETFRVRIEPDYEDILGRWAFGARLFKSLVPEYYFWVDTTPPHNLIKFTGKFGLEGTAPLQAWELTKIRSPHKPVN